MSWLYALYLRTLSEHQLREKRADLYLVRLELLEREHETWGEELTAHDNRMQAVTREMVRRGLLRVR